ncbi:MAG: Sensor protein [Phenylobacterium sp.]|nr:Sensor protein [Phenylobacterium sp.]
MTEASGEYRLLVLVVDDNATNRLVLAKTVELLGGQVMFAENGAEAVESGRGGAFDLVLMDIAMPIMDGIEATRRLRAHGVVTPIIAVTAHMAERDLPGLVETGFNDLIEKPITVPPIAEALDYAREFRLAS